MDLDPGSEVTVYCECGAKYRFSGSHMDDSVECAMCGRRVRMKGHNAVRSGAPERTALQAITERQGDAERVAQAVHLAREHHYQDALAVYENVLNSHPLMRDVFYGMGYCHYRLGDIQRALALLKLAQAGGHSTATDLVRKLEGALDSGRSVPLE